MALEHRLVVLEHRMALCTEKDSLIGPVHTPNYLLMQPLVSEKESERARERKSERERRGEIEGV